MAAQALNIVATVVRVVCSVIGAIILLFAVFVFFEANPTNGLVEFARNVREDFGWFTNDLFTPDDQKLADTVNAALAAIIWVVAGMLLSKLIVRLTPASKAKAG